MHYFISIPKLPKEFSHQSYTVELIKYLVKEHQEVDVGTPIAIVRNWWAEYQIDANGKGFISKIFFENGTYIKIGDPFAIITSDGEYIPYGKPYVLLHTKHIISQKPENKP